MTPAIQTVYGSLMYHRAELEALGDAAHQPPYNAPPKAPVLYIKPANTFSPFGGTQHLPDTHAQIQARVCVGLIFKPNQPLAGIESAQYAIKSIVMSDWAMALLCDFSLPYASFYRPPLRFNALDGSLALPQTWLEWPQHGLQDQRIETWVNGQCAHAYSTADWLVAAQTQLEAVSEFIAWEAGDVLMLGCPPDAALVKAGDVVEAHLGGQVFTRTVMASHSVFSSVSNNEVENAV
jgi:5-oxopent-3-ene-1,2,5-tricarboxylate decarboxylase / 2-hydroxyhepta-2,4-diene-1,7-dioate isomerase